MYYHPGAAYECLDNSSVSTVVPSSRLGVARVSSVVDNFGFFGVFLGVLWFPQILPRNALHFSIPSLHVISNSHSFISCHPSSHSRLGKIVGLLHHAAPMDNHADWWKAKRGAHHVLLHWTPSLSEHRLEQSVSEITAHHSSAQGPGLY